MSYEVTWDDCNPTMRFSDHVTWKEILRAYHDILANPCFDQIEYLITDYYDVDSFEVNQENLHHIQTVVRSSTRWNNHIRNAQIAKLDGAVKLIHVFLKKMENSGWTCKLFTNRDEAIQWCRG